LERYDKENDKKNHIKAHYFKVYSDYLSKWDFGKGFAKLAYERNKPEKCANILYNRSNITRSGVYGGTVSNKALSTKNIELQMETILNQGSDIICKYDRENDLTFEEKLLLFNHYGSPKSYFLKGLPTHKKKCEIREDDCFGRHSLVMDSQVPETIIAAEDTHIITIKSKDYLPFFEYFACLKERKKFLKLAFPGLQMENIMRLSCQLEERLFVNWENIYKEKEESDSIYIIKSGKAQVKNL